jgi:hypothetical protein
MEIMARNYKTESHRLPRATRIGESHGSDAGSRVLFARTEWRYLTIEVAPAHLKPALEGVRAFGMRGINLTIPHKAAVIPYLDALSSEARTIGAVNTVVRRGDE